MSAYVIVEIDVQDPVRYEEYKLMAPPSIAAYDGRYVARGGRTERLEGDWQPRRIVVLEFPTLERARQWWDSPEYAPAKRLRQQISVSDMIVVEGV